MGQEVSSSVSSCYFMPGSCPTSPQHVGCLPEGSGNGGGRRGVVCQSVPERSEKDNQGAGAWPEADGWLLSSPAS